MATSNPCGAGTWAVGGSAACVNCPAGYYCVAASTTPVSCPAGTFLATTGGTAAVSCGACIAGQYCPSASSAQVPCPAGQYGSTGSLGIPTCTGPCTAGNCVGLGSIATGSLQCTVGQFCDTPGLTSGTACTNGNYCPAGSSFQTVCASGTSSALPTAVCGNCAAQTYSVATSLLVGPTLCSSCPTPYTTNFASGSATAQSACSTVDEVSWGYSAAVPNSLAGSQCNSYTVITSQNTYTNYCTYFEATTNPSNIVQMIQGTATNVVGALLAPAWTGISVGAYWIIASTSVYTASAPLLNAVTAPTNTATNYIAFCAPVALVGATYQIPSWITFTSKSTTASTVINNWWAVMRNTNFGASTWNVASGFYFSTTYLSAWTVGTPTAVISTTTLTPYTMSPPAVTLTALQATIQKAVVIGSGSGTTLTVASFTSGALVVGMRIVGLGVAAGTTLSSFGTGTGANGG